MPDNATECVASYSSRLQPSITCNRDGNHESARVARGLTWGCEKAMASDLLCSAREKWLHENAAKWNGKVWREGKFCYKDNVCEIKWLHIIVE